MAERARVGDELVAVPPQCREWRQMAERGRVGNELVAVPQSATRAANVTTGAWADPFTDTTGGYDLALVLSPA